MLTRNDTSYQPDVSEQQLVWETNPDLGNSANGGLPSGVLDYFTSHGVVLESECPVETRPAYWDVPAPDDPWPLASGWENRVFKSTSNYNTIAQGTNIDFVKSCLKKWGPLTFAMQVDTDWYIPAPGSNVGSHVVVLVGFHDNLRGETAPGGGYWIVKNSWDTTWPESGGQGTITRTGFTTYLTGKRFNIAR
jgi:hypothetical protein